MPIYTMLAMSTPPRTPFLQYWPQTDSNPFRAPFLLLETVDGQNLAQVDVHIQSDSDDGRSHQAREVPSLTPEFNVEMHVSAEVDLCKILVRPGGVLLAATGAQRARFD